MKESRKIRVTIRGVDKTIANRIRQLAKQEGKKLGQVTTEAIEYWLTQKTG